MSIFCTLFALCTGVGAPSTPAGLPTFEQTYEVAAPLIHRWEGTGPTQACPESDNGICYRAYLDTIAEPDVWTIAFGQTRLFHPDGSVWRAVRGGDVLTHQDAVQQFGRGLERQYWGPYRDALTIDALATETDAAMTSLAWNIGVGAIRRSTALRRLNAGDVAGACEALTWWNRAGGRQVRGLVNRRADEYELCMDGTL